MQQRGGKLGPYLGFTVANLRLVDSLEGACPFLHQLVLPGMTLWPTVFRGKLTFLRKYPGLYQRAKTLLRRLLRTLSNTRACKASCSLRVIFPPVCCTRFQ